MMGPGALGQAMILAAGLGERLRPLTERRAKPSLPLMNRPLLLHHIDALSRAGVERVAVNLHHAPASLTEILAPLMEGPQAIALSREERILGTGGGVRRALHLLDPASPLLVLNGDSLAPLDLPALARSHARWGESLEAPATLALRPRHPGDRYTPVHVDGEGAICGIGRVGREGRPHIFLGAQIIDPEALEGKPDREPWDLVRDLYMPHLERGGRLGSFVHDGWWVEIGSARLYLDAHLALIEEQGFTGSLPASAGRPVRGAGPLLAGPGCTGLEGAVLDRCVIGPGCTVGEGARIERALLGAGVAIEGRARIREAIVWDGCRVQEDRRVEGALVHHERGAQEEEPLA